MTPDTSVNTLPHIVLYERENVPIPYTLDLKMINNTFEFDVIEGGIEAPQYRCINGDSLLSPS